MSALDTALGILGCFDGEAPELAVSELARKLGVAKSTVSRVLKTMAVGGLVEQHRETKRYVIGPLPHRFGQLYRAGTQVFDMVSEILADLVGETGFTGYIGVLDGLDIVILRMQQGRYPVRIVLDPGHRVPAFATAMGLALLARQSDDTLGDVLPPILIHAGMRLRQSRASVLAQLRTIRSRGWAAVEGTTFPGICAIGAAVSGGDHAPALGFALSFPTGAITIRQRTDLASRIGKRSHAAASRATVPRKTITKATTSGR